MEVKVPLLAENKELVGTSNNNQEQQYGGTSSGAKRKNSDQMDWKQHHLRSKAANRNRTLLVKAILLASLLVATIFLSRFLFRLLKIQFNHLEAQPPSHLAHLKLVSIFNRHGDRAPSDSLPKGDRHKEKVDFFWPNGLHNLTEAGKLRLFKMGADTRRQYQEHLDYDSNSILAFSSHFYRCRQSMEFFLRGLYDLDTTLAQGRLRLADYESCRLHFANASLCPQMGGGSGSGREWEQVKVDVETVSSLSFTKLNSCAYRLKHPSEVDDSLLNSASIKQMDPKGLEMMREVLANKYDRPMAFDGLNIFSTVVAELSLTRTRDTFNYTDHFNDWINLEVSRRGDSVVTLFDFFEQIVVYAQRDRVSGLSNKIQSGTLITNLIQSQQVALGQQLVASTDSVQEQFKDKKLVIYSSHDTILQLLLFTLGIITADGSFEDRFHKWQRSQNELGMFRDGFKMSQYGLSARFELWQLESDWAPSLPVVRVSMYNRADSKNQQVVYEPIEFGSICIQRHKQQYPQTNDDELERDFYLAGQYNIDRRTDCPFELFRNITADMMIGDEQLNQLCDTNGDKQLLHNNNSSN